MSEPAAPSGGPRPFIVAMDGPAGAGKSTAARRLADRLGLTLVDTGAIYRTVALAAHRAGIRYDDDARLGDLLPRLAIRFEPPLPGEGPSGRRVLLGDEDVSAPIRTRAMSLGASAVSARPVVRAGLLELQRRLATAPGTRGAVLEGRDIGTVVFPDADLKFFLTASAEERAARRLAEIRGRGESATYEEVLADQRKRDEDDSRRALAPLKPADDAQVIDTTGMSLDQVTEELFARAEAQMAERGAGR